MLIQDYPENNQWSIGYYIIDIDYRNKGIGFELFKGIENILLSLGAKSVQIVIQEQNNRGLHCKMCPHSYLCKKGEFVIDSK